MFHIRSYWRFSMKFGIWGWTSFWSLTHRLLPQPEPQRYVKLKRHFTVFVTNCTSYQNSCTLHAHRFRQICNYKLHTVTLWGTMRCAKFDSRRRCSDISLPYHCVQNLTPWVLCGWRRSPFTYRTSFVQQRFIARHPEHDAAHPLVRIPLTYNVSSRLSVMLWDDPPPKEAYQMSEGFLVLQLILNRKGERA